MAVHDTMLRLCLRLSKNIHLFRYSLGVKILGKVLVRTFIGSVQSISQPDRQSKLQMLRLHNFLADILLDHGSLTLGSVNLRKTFQRISLRFGKNRDLNLRDISSLLISYNTEISRFFTLHSYRNYFFAA